MDVIRAQEEWREPPKSLRRRVLYVAPPETLPGWPEVLAYFNEYTILHDDASVKSNKQSRH